MSEFVVMQDRADGHWPTKDNPSGDVWMYYMGQGLLAFCGHIEDAKRFYTKVDAENFISERINRDNESIKNGLIPGGRYKIIEI